MEIPNRNNFTSTYDWIQAFEKLPFYGWYQESEDKERGTSIWSTYDGQEVAVTQVTRINQSPSDNHIFIALLEGYQRRTINYK
jgi:hypothetical protein